MPAENRCDCNLSDSNHDQTLGARERYSTSAVVSQSGSHPCSIACDDVAMHMDSAKSLPRSASGTAAENPFDGVAIFGTTRTFVTGTECVSKVASTLQAAALDNRW